jgi:S-adenosylhomocysteine hydrolase
LPDTYEFIRLLVANGFLVDKVIGIDYSSRVSVIRQLRSSGIDAVVPDAKDLPKIIRQTLSESLGSGTRALIVHEVGGYCADALRRNPDVLADRCIGIVEETKQGLWRYRRLPRLRYPLFQIADSRLKDVEGLYVGSAVVRSMENDLRSAGLRKRGLRVGVLGMGVIGRSVLRRLSDKGFEVGAWDRNPTSRLEAASAGHPSVRRAELLRRSNVIVAATGGRSIKWSELHLLTDNVLLASASSRRVEFPVEQIKSRGVLLRRSGHVHAYLMPWRKTIQLSTAGSPINFRTHSLPRSVADLMFAQVAMCISKLSARRQRPGIHGLSSEDQDWIRRSWEKQYRRRLPSL